VRSQREGPVYSIPFKAFSNSIQEDSLVIAIHSIIYQVTAKTCVAHYPRNNEPHQAHPHPNSTYSAAPPFLPCGRGCEPGFHLKPSPQPCRTSSRYATTNTAICSHRAISTDLCGPCIRTSNPRIASRIRVTYLSSKLAVVALTRRWSSRLESAVVRKRVAFLGGRVRVWSAARVRWQRVLLCWVVVVVVRWRA
jgi:hypothetical protein